MRVFRGMSLLVPCAIACGGTPPRPQLAAIAVSPAPPPRVEATEPAPPTERRGTTSFLAVVEALAESHVWLSSYDERDGVLEIGLRGEPHAIAACVKRLTRSLDDIVLEDTRPLLQDPDLQESKVRAHARDGHASLAVHSPEDAHPLLADTQRSPFDAWPRASAGLTVSAEDSSVSALSLVAVVNRHDGARAMLIDAAKMGWIARRGDLVGRAPCRYRVKEVRPTDIVLAREDATCTEPPQRILRLDRTPSAGSPGK